MGAPTTSASKRKRKVASKQSRCGGSSSEELEQADGRRQVESTSNGGRGRGLKTARRKPASSIR